MIPIQEFRAENAEIKDLCNILGTIVEHEELRNNNIVCELLERFTDRVNKHLAHEDRSIYRDLLKKHTHEADVLADHFLSNTQELRRIFNEYKRDWCMKPHSSGQQQKYVDESRQIFRLVCERISFEEEKIFPHFES